MEIFLNEYVADRAHRALTLNISDTGLYANKVLTPMNRTSRVVQLEFELPGTAETIWAKGEITHDSLDEYFHGQGIRFTGMARFHARLLRDYCIEKRRAQLGTLLERIRRNRMH
jgi:c-di-GMP-binding flagellar brake protein YcgR